MKPNPLNCLVRALLNLTCLVASHSTWAQSLPPTAVWLADIKDGRLGKPQLISLTTGYHNQPRFSEDGERLFFTSEQEGGQTDIVEFDLISGETRLLTSSAESEYSPIPIPGDHALSVVRVEPNQRQRLWRLDLQTLELTVLLSSVEPVGYYDWIDSDNLALFILGEPVSLHLATLSSGRSHLRFEHIGRTLRGGVKHGELFFIDKNTHPWQISAMDLDTGIVSKVRLLFPGTEDFWLSTDDSLWMGSGAKIYRSVSTDRLWRLVEDLSEYGLVEISRITLNPANQSLAIVSAFGQE